jgi:septal ring factor EnvC (AmiA/AmiB activator)
LRARVIVVALALGLACAGAFAQGASERAQREAQAEQRLQALRAQIRQLAEQQRAVEGERNAASEAMRAIDGKVDTALRALRSTEAAIATQDAELQRLQTQQSSLQQQLSGQREALAALVRSAYALGRHEQLKLLLAQDRISDLARVLAYHRYFQNDRRQRIETLLAQLRRLAQLGEQVQTQKDILAASQQQQQTDLAALESQRGERARVLAQIESGFSDRAARLKALGRDEASVVALLERLRDALADIPAQVEDNRPFASRKGQLPLPLAGQALARFGGALPDGRRSEGLLIAGTAGAEVRAVAPGRVAFADWLKGYGLLVIVDHGDGWMTLYAFNDALLKDVGDWVRGGEAVASVGSSGGQGRPALYFELRRNGQPQDPRPWWRP